MAACPDGRCDGSGFLFDESARTSRTTCGCARWIDGSGSRSHETSRKALGIRPATAAARRRACRTGRHEHG